MNNNRGMFHFLYFTVTRQNSLAKDVRLNLVIKEILLQFWKYSDFDTALNMH